MFVPNLKTLMHLMFPRASDANSRRKRSRANRGLWIAGERLEARQLLTTYFIDPVNGSDAYPGTIDQPFKTPYNLSQTFASGNSNFKQLVAGDTVELREGVHDWSDLLTNLDSNFAAFFLSGVHGTAENPVTIEAFPGEHPVVQGRVAEEAKILRIENSDYVRVLGLEFRDTYGVAIWASESRDIEIANNYVHDVDGRQVNNIAGIYSLSNLGIHIHDNLLHDNFDHQNALAGTATENARNIVIFGENSDRVEVDHNTIFNTPTGRVQGAGIFIKHADTIPGASFEIHDNLIRDVSFTAIGSQASNVSMHNNLIIDSPPFQAFTGDNVTTYHDLVFENNTYVGDSVINFRLDPGDNLTFPQSGFMTFRNNIVVDDAAAYTTENALIRIAHYGKDADYDDIVSPQNLVFDNNIYFNPQATPTFDVFGAEDGQYGVLGALLDLTGWQALGIDLHSQVADPQLDEAFIPQNSAASSAGWLSGAGPRLSMYIQNDLFAETAGMNAATIVLIRDPDQVASPLTVTLSNSDPTEIEIPSEVTFEPGVRVLQIPVNALNDFQNEPTRAVQITAAATGELRTSGWVRVMQEGSATGPHLALNGTDVTWTKKQDPVSIVPQITVDESPDLGGGSLMISLNAVSTKRKLLDHFSISSAASIGATDGPAFSNGLLTIQIQLKANVTSFEIQNVLRQMTFATAGKGLKRSTRSVALTLTDSNGMQDTVSQTIHVQRKAARMAGALES